MIPVLLATVLLATPQAAPGRKILEQLALDIDGDGREEIALAERVTQSQRVVVSFLRQDPVKEGDPQTYTRIFESAPKSGLKMARFEAKRIAGRTPPELFAVIEDPTPDEIGQHLRIYSAGERGIKEIFAQTFYLPAPQPKDPSVVEFGDASPQYLLVDLEEEEGGDLEVVWTKDARKLRLEGKDGMVAFVIGAHRTVYRYDRKKEEYGAGEAEAIDFLPEKEELEANIPAAIDGDLDTAWTVLADKKSIGASLSVKFKEATDVSLIRIVPGCGDAADWATRPRIEAFRLVLGSGAKVELDRRKLVPPPFRVKAAAELPLTPEYGAQLLVFFAEPQNMRWAKVEIADIEVLPPQPKKDAETRVNEACVGEISFH